MKRKIQKIIEISALVAFSAAFMTSGVAFADDNKTAILNSSWTIEDILNLVLVILTTGVGIISVGAIAFAGFLYTTAGSNSGQVAKAKDMLKNTVFGIIAYLLMWAFIQWLIPGGVL